MDFASASMDLLEITAKAQTFVITKIVQEMVLSSTNGTCICNNDSQGIIVKNTLTYVQPKFVQEMVFVIMIMNLHL